MAYFVPTGWKQQSRCKAFCSGIVLDLISSKDFTFCWEKHLEAQIPQPYWFEQSTALHNPYEYKLPQKYSHDEQSHRLLQHELLKEM